MSDTPQTDAHIERMEMEDFDAELALTKSFARKLERERNEAREALTLLKEAFISAENFINSHIADPDITEKMAHNYAIYQQNLTAIQHLLQ